MKKPSKKTLAMAFNIAFKAGLVGSLLCVAYSLFSISSEVSRTNKILSLDGMYSTDPSLKISISHLLAVIADATETISKNTLSDRTRTEATIRISSKLGDLTDSLTEKLSDIADTLEYVIPEESARSQRSLMRLIETQRKAQRLADFKKMMEEEAKPSSSTNLPPGFEPVN